jgi:hypothetical protein
MITMESEVARLEKIVEDIKPPSGAAQIAEALASQASLVTQAVVEHINALRGRLDELESLAMQSEQTVRAVAFAHTSVAESAMKQCKAVGDEIDACRTMLANAQRENRANG